ncbi:MAG: hypothetical protein ACR2MG_08365 [Pyrinomonadaceae bacterium]
MGQITIKVPQKVKKSYRMTDVTVADEIITRLEITARQPDKKKVSDENKADLRDAKKVRAEYERTRESYTVAELRKKFGLSSKNCWHGKTAVAKIIHKKLTLHFRQD